jgi:hypothetical protein
MSDQPSAASPQGTAPPLSLTPEQLQQRQQQQALAAAMRGGVPLIYANSFAIVQTSSDVSIIMMANGNPAAMISLSYTSAKSLIPDLQTAVATFEEVSGQKIKTINELNPAMEKKLRERNAFSR